MPKKVVVKSDPKQVTVIEAARRTRPPAAVLYPRTKEADPEFSFLYGAYYACHHPCCRSFTLAGGP
jgi:hypothetical protein